jgi:2,4-dienoyl-CoA reductase-like NADH-dependent reductase (Old Yellow Enzyme family)
VAVRHDGRANPNQLMLTEQTLPDLKRLRETLVEAHVERHGSAEGLLVGVQLTHSGRFARPNSKTKLEPVIAYHHPYLDEKFGVPADQPVISDAELDQLVQLFVERAQMAQSIGFDFVDVKHCHGYLGHELLSAFSRPGKYGGSFENRTRFLREVTAGIRRAAPGLRIGVRLSVFDFPPYQMDKETKIGIPTPLKYPGCYWFGVNPTNPFEIDLSEPVQFLSLLRELGIELVNLTAGSPYYVPHIQRPALFPPSDGYQPPEDPLVGVARQVNTAGDLKRQFPDLAVVGTGYSYLQEWLPNVGQHQVRSGAIDFVGLGRMVLSYPEMAADVLAGNPLDRKHICRTFSDCTTAPRNGLISGCYPLDDFYRARPERDTLEAVKRRAHA